MSTLRALTQAVHQAIDDCNEAAADAAVSGLVDWLHRNPSHVSEIDLTLLDRLKHKRMLTVLQTLAEALTGLGHVDPKVRLNFGQALIDLGSPSAAIDILRKISDRSDLSMHSRVEVEGLQGRAFKDLFVKVPTKSSGRGVELLNMAIKHYTRGFEASDRNDNWTGENLLGLLSQAQRWELPIEAELDGKVISRNIVGAIEKIDAPERKYWHWASLAIVHFVRGNWEDSSKALREALSAEGATSFAINGTLRQLREIWDLDDNGGEPKGLITALQARLLEMPKGHLQLSAEDMRQARTIDETHYERILGAEGPRTRKWMLRFLNVGESVGLISQKLGEGVGTCFIVNGGDFHEDLRGERLLLTNDHVISPEPEVYRSSPPLRTEKAEVSFEVFSSHLGEQKFKAKEIVWSSGSQDHDACLFRVDGDLPDELEALEVVDHVPLVDEDEPEGVYIVGHPGGRSLSYSMQNNELLDHDCDVDTNEPRHIHYFTPTEKGSSGSPAMNSELDVIGLHHAGGKYMAKLNSNEGTYPANEAVWLKSIRMAARTDLSDGHTRYKR